MGLTGGNMWDRMNIKEEQHIEVAPRIIRIFDKNNKAYKDKTGPIRVSPDGVFIGVVLLTDAQIRVY